MWLDVQPGRKAWILVPARDTVTKPHSDGEKNKIRRINSDALCIMHSWSLNKAELGGILNKTVWFYHKIHSPNFILFYSLVA